VLKSRRYSLKLTHTGIRTAFALLRSQNSGTAQARAFRVSLFQAQAQARAAC
jgi:hypothetical protein